MKNIAILTSSDGARGRRLVELFNNGERFRVALLLSDRMAEALENFSRLQIPAACAAPQEWTDNPVEILASLHDNNIDILVLDDFDLPVHPDIAAAFEGRIVTLDDNTDARQIIDRFGDGFATETKWAETLGMDFDPERAMTPPPVPGNTRPTPPPVPPVPPAAPQFSAAPESAPQSAPAGEMKPKKDPGTPPMPKTYLIWSVLSLVLCCFAAGVVAVVFSSSVSTKYYAGDYEGAEKSSERAQIWIIISIVVGVVTNAMFLPMMMVG